MRKPFNDICDICDEQTQIGMRVVWSAPLRYLLPPKFQDKPSVYVAEQADLSLTWSQTPPSRRRYSNDVTQMSRHKILRLVPCFKYANSEGSGETAWMR